MDYLGLMKLSYPPDASQQCLPASGVSGDWMADLRTVGLQAAAGSQLL